MNTSQALTKVDEALTGLQLKDASGDPLVGLEAIGLVAQFKPFLVRQYELEFEQNVIPAEDYAAGMCILIRQFSEYLQARKIFRNLEKLEAFQDGFSA